tara:strand:+ start:18956 stop:19420 length:465 start_codon:yes stop_codon:yes gene_type:complete
MSKNTQGKGKVKTVQGNGGGPGSFMDLYKYEVTLEDGTTGNMYKKSDNPYLSPGDEVSYTINAKGTFKVDREDGGTFTPKPKDNYAKVPTSTVGLSRDELIVRQTCIKAAVDFCKNANCSPEEVTANAQIFRDWVFYDGKEKKTSSEKINDLPF